MRSDRTAIAIAPSLAELNLHAAYTLSRASLCCEVLIFQKFLILRLEERISCARLREYKQRHFEGWLLLLPEAWRSGRWRELFC